jgi:DNA repair protein RadC
VSENGSQYRITDIDTSERPRERMERLGPGALSDGELMAILLRVGIPGTNAIELGQLLLQKFGGIYGIHQAPFHEVCEVKGMGTAKAAQLKAALELGNRMVVQTVRDRVVHSPEDAAAFVRHEMSALEQEELRVILLDTRNRIIEVDEIYKGSINSSQVRIAELFKKAIRRNAPSIILVHNHPSGDPTPSPEDIAVTRAIVQAGRLLDIEVLDHLVIGSLSFVSLKERGLGFG